MARRSIATLIALIACMMLAAPGAGAQEGVNVISDAPRNDFPVGVTFTLSFTAPETPNEVRLRYQLAPDGTGTSTVAQCTAAATINCTHTLTSGRGIFIIPGAEITYQWEIEDASGNRTSTDEQLYVHTDTRFTFFELTQNGVTVYYHLGTEDYAQAALNASVETLNEIGALLNAEVSFPVKVFLYETAQEMQPAIAPGGGRGVQVLGEVVYSDTAMVSADVAMLDITRHEIAHIVTREALKGPFDIPGWLNEGISVYAQRQPLPGHAAALDNAIRTDRVLSMTQLSSPSVGGVAGTVSLYYGQSGAIVGYLVEEYGAATFAELIATFRQGSRVDNAFETVYGFDTRGLEDEWRASVGLQPRVAAPTPTPDPSDDGSDDATPPSGTTPPGDGGGSSNDTSVVTWALIAAMAASVLAAGAYSFRVIRSRI